MALQVTPVATHVWHVTASHTNFVIVAGGGSATLIDTGYPRDRKLIEASFEFIGRSLRDVAAIVLTHGHPDHLGSARRLREEHGMDVRCLEEERPLVRGEVLQRISTWELWRAWRPPIFRFAVNAITKGGLTARSVPDPIPFGDGAVLDLPGRPVAIATPGHTSGHCAFHLPDRGVLITGDALVTMDVWDPTRQGPQLLRRPFNHDHDQARRSLNRLRDIQAEVILPGHGAPWWGSPAEAVAVASAR